MSDCNLKQRTSNPTGLTVVYYKKYRSVVVSSDERCVPEISLESQRLSCSWCLSNIVKFHA